MMRLGLALLLLPAAAFALSESVQPEASLAQPMDQVGVGARGLAMGSAYVGVAEGSEALVWNSAGLGSLKAMDVSLHHNSGLAGMVQETLYFGAPLGRLGAFAAGFNYIDNGSFEGRDASGNKTAGFKAGSLGFQAGWGGELGGGLALGLVGKGTSQQLAGSSYSSFAADLGALWAPTQALKIGLNYANLGSPVGGSSKANGLRLGASLKIPLADSQLLLAAATQFQPAGVSRIQLGAEGGFSKQFFIRAGYQLNLENTAFEGLSGMTLGAGLKLGGFGLDYAYLPYGELGSSQRVSLNYSFGQPEPEPQPAPKKKAAKKGSAPKAKPKKHTVR